MKKPTEHGHKCGPECRERVMSFETPFGMVAHFPDSPEGLTFVVLADGSKRRVRGAEKRLLLTLLGAIGELREKARIRPLPKPCMN